MITHYDMLTGEVIGIDSHREPAAPGRQVAAMPALRLTTVQEAGGHQPSTGRRHRAVMMHPIALLLAGGRD